MSADTFATRLDNALKRAGSSQARLAREADIDQSSISRYLRGQCEPNLRQFRAIANALKVAPSHLLGDESASPILAPSGKEHHYYVFLAGKLAGEWTGETLKVFVGAEVANGETANDLIASLERSRGRRRARDEARNGRKGPSRARRRPRRGA